MRMITSARQGKANLGMVVLLAALFLIPQISYGAIAPEVTNLLTLSNLSFPGKVAADRSGNIYVADTYYKVIRIYGSNGTQKGAVQLQYDPTALAVSTEGLLYVGEAKAISSGRVEVFTSSGEAAGGQDMSTPLSIALLSTGEMLVVTDIQVKKLDASFNTVFDLNKWGSENGSFITPSSVAVDEAHGKFYVLDKGGIATESGYAGTYVWRVQQFDLSGSFIGSFSNYGYGIEGKVGSASSIAVDGQGRVYVADNSQGIIVAYDGDSGAYLKTLDGQMGNPVSLGFVNDRLYAASKIDKMAVVYGIDAYAQLAVDPTSLAISYQQGMSAPSRTVRITNTGRGTLSWQATSADSWLALSTPSGDVAPLGSQDLTLTLDTTGFAAGNTYSGAVAITSNGGAETVGVQVVVYTQPELLVSPASFNVTKKTTETAPPMDVNISIANDMTGGSMMWQASSDAAWLTLSPTSGITNTVPAPSIRIAEGIPAGSYTGHITVTADGASGSPAAITVNLEVVSANKISVTTNNADATFTITGPAVYSGTGTAYSIDGATAGLYTVTFGSVSGFKTPAPITQTLEEGGEVVFAGSYLDLRRQVNIITSRGASSTQTADIAVFRADGTPVLSLLPFSYAYGAVTASGDVDGDGSADILAAGGGMKVPSIVQGFSRDGSGIPGLSFYASNTGYGVNIAAGDFDGDGKDEIITGSLKSSIISIFTYLNGQVYSTGVNFTAYPDNGNSVYVSAADVDGDGIAELVAYPKNITAGAATIPQVSIYRVNTSAGFGQWAVERIGGIDACTLSGTNMTTADMDGDGASEIITLCTTDAGTTEIREYRASGELLRTFGTGSTKLDHLAAGDTNMDGIAEIIIGDADAKRATEVKILDSTGVLINSFEAFSDSFGVRVSAGNLGY